MHWLFSFCLLYWSEQPTVLVWYYIHRSCILLGKMLSLVVICLQDNTKMYNKSVSWVLKKKKNVLYCSMHSTALGWYMSCWMVLQKEELIQSKGKKTVCEPKIMYSRSDACKERSTFVDPVVWVFCHNKDWKSIKLWGHLLIVPSCRNQHEMDEGNPLAFYKLLWQVG